MTSKERVHRALRREPVDRVPVYMWFHPGTALHLSKLLEIPPQKLQDVMGNDVRQTWVNNNYAMEGVVHEEDGQSHTDDWGITWTKQGPFNQVSKYPLAGLSRSEVDEYEFPYDRADFLLGLMDPVAAQSDEYFIGCDVSPCAFEIFWRLRSMDDALLDMAQDPDFTARFLRKAMEFTLEMSRRACEEFELDWLWAGDDVAGQFGMMMSPEMWREQLRDDLTEVFDLGRSYDLVNAYHSCGAIRPIIPDLIEMGLDVLNPIQAGCPGMDAVDLKREYGSDLSFMGGVDTQGVLPHGSADEVKRATALLVEEMTSDGGGYILAASHTIPPETPDENIFAMYDAAGISEEEIYDRAADVRSAPVGS